MKKSNAILIFYFLLANAVFAQKTITGIIKDKEGLPVVGTTVLVKGTNNYATANADGQFSLTVSEEPPLTLVVRFLGFKTQEIVVSAVSQSPLEVVLVDDGVLSEVVITARRREETAQEVPISITVISGSTIGEKGAFNVNRLKELVPSVQLYTSNPRNTGLNIRGLGSPFGLTNDGLDPGVGFYVDGVYYARPAAATLDFIDIEQIEVLRGPQGTLFGKNTTAGAFNITTRKPSFKPSGNFELSYGNYNFIQAKASITGPLIKNRLAARISFSGTQRNGTIGNIRTGKFTNELNNLGIRGQLLYTPTNKISIILAADASAQSPDGYAQVVAGVVQTERPAYRQFNAIIADLNYSLPSLNAFDRKIDHDTPWRSGNSLGGVSLTADIDIGPGALTSTTAWRYWDWDPSNDRDFTGLQALSKSQNPSRHSNWSQEIRYAAQFNSKLSTVIGLYYIDQEVKTYGTEESGNAQYRFSQSSTSALWATPGLFDGYGIRTTSSIKSLSAAAFANVDWEIINGLHFLPGIRFNYDKKDVLYDRATYGGLQTTNAALLALKAGVYSDQFYQTYAEENNFTYSLSVAYRPNKRINAFATYSTSYKPVGVNVAGLPTANGAPSLELAKIKPESVENYEIGIKTTPTDNFIVNLTFYNTDIQDYQTNVQSPELGVNRGYLANAEKVNVRGFELDANIKLKRNFTFFGAVVYTEGKYVAFKNAPLPLEETGKTDNGVQVAFKDISGSDLPGISKWAGSLGGEVYFDGSLFGNSGSFFFSTNAYYRSSFSSSPSPSKFLNINEYTILNAQIGFRANEGLSLFVWSRNLLNENYFEQLLPAGGNAGQYAGVLGDPATFGVTLKYAYK